MSKKRLKFISNGVHVGFNDYGFNWKVGDEHNVDAKDADYATKTFPTLFVVVDSTKEKKVDKEKIDNKMFGKKKDE